VLLAESMLTFVRSKHGIDVTRS